MKLKKIEREMNYLREKGIREEWKGIVTILATTIVEDFQRERLVQKQEKATL